MFGNPRVPVYKMIALFQMLIALGILLFWISFFTLQPVVLTDPLKTEIYHAYEHAFVVPDLILTLLLLLAAINLLRRQQKGVVFTLISSGMLVFLGLLDFSFNLQQGIYQLGSSEAFLNGFINFNCVLWGTVFSISILTQRQYLMKNRKGFVLFKS